ncbi:hypothetical protein GCM10008088_22370 [Mesonia mobilis]|uniref:Uncharacterized protein n=1 Tax=Mesonia mobilis TaxID=369791 RepID=A0ABQ3BX98_9FLAO|nr:hypothetical protein GCM10008088_22370 [Mesonia mobilis]
MIIIVKKNINKYLGIILFIFLKFRINKTPRNGNNILGSATEIGIKNKNKPHKKS